MNSDDKDELAVDRICGDCEVAGAANYCKNCEMSFCDTCKQKHLAQKVLRNHVVVLHSEYKTCSIHPGEEIKISCACGELLCGICAVVSHEVHEKSTLQGAATKHQRNIVELSSELVGWVETVFDEALKSVANHASHILGLHEFINTVAAKLIECINRQVIREKYIFLCHTSTCTLLSTLRSGDIVLLSHRLLCNRLH